MNTRPYHLVVLSAHKDGLSIGEEHGRLERAINTLESATGYSWQPAKGVYKGQAEESIMVRFGDVDKLRLLINIGATLEQECILHVDTNDGAELIYSGNVHVSLGRWVEISKAEAAARDHTYVPSIDSYFTTTKS